jgi:hypothetical protein
MRKESKFGQSEEANPMNERTDSGVLFVNKKRGDNTKAPNLKGTGRVTIDGREYELDLAGWTRQSEKAGKFLSLSIKVKGDYAAAGKDAAHRQDEMDVPF